MADINDIPMNGLTKVVLLGRVKVLDDLDKAIQIQGLLQKLFEELTP